MHYATILPEPFKSKDIRELRETVPTPAKDQFRRIAKLFFPPFLDGSNTLFTYEELTPILLALYQDPKKLASVEQALRRVAWRFKERRDRDANDLRTSPWPVLEFFRRTYDVGRTLSVVDIAESLRTPLPNFRKVVGLPDEKSELSFWDAYQATLIFVGHQIREETMLT